MTLITKRSGAKEAYDPQKLKASLGATSDEIGEPLNESDLNYLADEVSRMLEGRTNASTYDIYVIVVGLLFVRRLYKVVDAYTKCDKNCYV